MKNPNELEGIRHSLAHLLAASVRELYSGAQNAIGPAIESGFYQDFGGLAKPISEADLPAIEKKMREVLKKWSVFERREVTVDEARKEFSWNPYKLELIEELSKEGAPITFYTSGGFIDLCKGGHAQDVRDINPDAFKLTRIAGAYWRGDSAKPMLTRIYGVAFATKKELDEYLRMLEEAEKRDHKKLGPQLDLFHFSELVGGGLPLFTPRGTIVREELEDFVQALQVPAGYQRVRIPHITKKELYQTSGHWDKFKDELFKIKTREGHAFAMKPMNCPHHIQIYASLKRSYRDLPLRYSEVTACYRDEQSGELSGLSRLRAFTQDDAHVFCRISQFEKEALKAWDIIDAFYKPFDMPLAVRFSRHDPQHFEKYLGTPEVWKEAEKRILSLIKKRGVEYIDGLGEAAMYGPKVDFIAKDSLGRQWQLATIQLDFNMPERFNLTCVNEQGQEERIVMMHRAISGSIERFMSVLIEHFAGAFPLWLSPVQAAVLPVGEKFLDYAKTVQDALAASGIRAELSDANETLGKRIREAELRKVPYVVVVGEKEEQNRTVNVRHYRRGSSSAKAAEDRQEGEIALDQLAEKLKKEIAEKTA